jgi:hypothetical protein
MKMYRAERSVLWNTAGNILKQKRASL